MISVVLITQYGLREDITVESTTKREADYLKIETLTEWSGVPKGTFGQAEWEKFDNLYRITWDLERYKNSRFKLRDWFTKKEFNKYLKVC